MNRPPTVLLRRVLPLVLVELLDAPGGGVVHLTRILMFRRNEPVGRVSPDAGLLVVAHRSDHLDPRASRKNTEARASAATTNAPRITQSRWK
jgi:hypothetical protein